MANDLVKQDINFLEYPLWFQDERAESKKDGFIWQDREGFIHRSSYKPPVKMDFVFLLYLLMKSQEAGWTDKLDLTRYEILKACGLTDDKRSYARLTDGMKRWEMVHLEFSGSFYDGKTYQTLHFGVVDSFGIEEGTKRLKIRFSPEWLLRIKESQFFKLLDFDQIKTLRSPLNIRLYEILVKSFIGRSTWQIDAMKLAQKIPMDEKYPSDVVPKIKAAVNRITQVTDLHINLSVEKERGKAMLTFTKTEGTKPSKKTARKEPPESLAEPVQEPISNPDLETLISQVHPNHRHKQSVRQAITKALTQYTPEQITKAIQYTNGRSNGSYAGYLAKALKEDWGLVEDQDKQAEAEKKRQTEEEQRAKIRQAEAEREQEKAKEAKAKELLKAMSEQDKAALRERALKELHPALRRNEQSIKTVMLSLIMEQTQCW